ncbi:hypothetical protein QBC40DRAFT_283323 [Triangularia verruculosa]|uniref:Integral membrane protein n=1 Tax=Triangularia verruculosa TaxID=2587418 RepID=A0AAN7AV75_9PEZI|nr:hypothetical protein QBC40DRAFT_283323 [Triangularia verruculosa]
MQPDNPSPTDDTSHVNNYFSGARPALQAQQEQSTPDSNAAPLTPITEQPPQHVATSRPPPTPARSVAFRPLDRHQSAIQLRRLRPAPLSSRLTPTVTHEPQTQAHDWEEDNATDDGGRTGGRRRSSSEPQRPSMPRTIETVHPLSSVPEDSARSAANPDGPPHVGRFHRALGRRRQTVLHPHQLASPPNNDVYDSRVVDFLDVIDPEVATLSSITNIQNSLFLPSLGKWVNRRPTYDLSRLPPMPGAFPPSKESIASAAAAVQEEQHGEHTGPRSPSLSSVLTSEPQYAILPNDASLQGWREGDVKLLNDYVRHMLHSRRSKIKQRFKAFGKYVRRPLGFLITLYATLITLFGLAWVLFLIGWVYVGEKQLYVINVIDYVLVALFGLVGDGMAPFRAKDTYHMFFVARYHRKTWRRRKRLALPDLKDHNDLPTGEDTRRSEEDLEAQPAQHPSSSTEKITENEKDEFVPVLSEKQQARLVHHQAKLAKSHTFFKPHETETHHAFPLRLLIAIVLLLDLHSLLQISLGAVTFGIPYETRPVAATTTILCCSIVTNITAGLLITIGDRRTRKKDVLERLMRQEMTGEVIKKIEKKKEKERKQEEEQKQEEETGVKTRKSLNLTLPWKENTDDDGGEARRARSLSIPRTRRRKEKEGAGRFSSEMESIGGRSNKEVRSSEKRRIPGAFEED